MIKQVYKHQSTTISKETYFVRHSFGFKTFSTAQIESAPSKTAYNAKNMIISSVNEVLDYRTLVDPRNTNELGKFDSLTRCNGTTLKMDAVYIWVALLIVALKWYASIGTLIFKILSSLANRSSKVVTRDSLCVKIARPAAHAVPGFVWETITTAIFFAGHLLRIVALHSWTIAIFAFDIPLGLHMIWALSIVCIAICDIQEEYAAFINLGAGGTPHTFRGFRRLTLLAWFGRIDVLEPPEHNLGKGYLPMQFPRVDSERPVIGGIAPQRQLDKRSTKDIHKLMVACFNHFATTTGLRTGLSFLEKKTEAIFCDQIAHESSKVFGCEVAHPHHVDGSLHVVLHPEDLARVINNGWGERHPIARADTWWNWWFFTTEIRPPVPHTLALIYAPQGTHDLVSIMSIVKAGALFAGDEITKQIVHEYDPDEAVREVSVQVVGSGDRCSG